MISRLSDDQVREVLIRQLDKLAAEEAGSGETASFTTRFEQGLQELQRRLGAFQIYIFFLQMVNKTVAALMVNFLRHLCC